jgi:hypothetical protein
MFRNSPFTSPFTRSFSGAAAIALVVLCGSARAESILVPTCPAISFAPSARGTPESVRLVTGMPYSALGTSETTTLRPDGIRVVHQNKVRVWRDSIGRTRSEFFISGVAGPMPLELNTTLTVIDDPAAQKRYVLRDADRVAVTMPIVPCRIAEPAPSGNAGAPVLLGERKVGGEVAAGSRIEATIPAGAIGNDRPLQMSAEQWFAKEVQVVVEATYRDPRSGDTNFRLRDIQRTEPDAALFRVPKEYSRRPATSEIRSWSDRRR